MKDKLSAEYNEKVIMVDPSITLYFFSREMINGKPWHLYDLPTLPKPSLSLKRVSLRDETKTAV